MYQLGIEQVPRVFPRRHAVTENASEVYPAEGHDKLKHGEDNQHGSTGRHKKKDLVASTVKLCRGGDGWRRGLVLRAGSGGSLFTAGCHRVFRREGGMGRGKFRPPIRIVRATQGSSSLMWVSKRPLRPNRKAVAGGRVVPDNRAP